jgi:uncharacterized protein (TIGR03083 family)
MDRALLVGATEREGRALLDIARTGLDAPVPTCAGWHVADGVGHLGGVYRSVSEIIERRAQDIPAVEIPRPPEGRAVLDYFATGLDRLVTALAGIDAGDAVYTWSDQRNGAFYHRRMAHETALHRWDVASAHGSPAPFATDLAADGVDELYAVVLPFGVKRWGRALPAGSLHLHRTDGPGEWLVAGDGEGGLALRREHAKGDVAVRGPASELVVFAWNRGRGPGIEVFGDDALADQWAALAP